MNLPLFQVDAFTDRRFGGNPAAVVLLEHWLPDPVLLAVAAENNLSETAFVIPGTGDIPLRWFTPAVEIDLCGHATLAAAHVLFNHVTPSVRRITFTTLSGKLVVTNDGDHLTMDFPARPADPVGMPAGLESALGIRPAEVLQARDLLVVLESEDQVRKLRPDMVRMTALEAFAVCVSAPGDRVDFVSRFFAPKAGIPEDPVTGSAHCTLVPYWAERLGKTSLVAKQVSARGGDLECRLAGGRVFMSGKSVDYLRGEIEVDA